MPRKFIQRYIPDHKTIREQKCLRFLGSWLHNPSLWHLNRHSVAGAFFVGMVCAFVPIPFQMVLAALMAILLQVNIPVSVALVWLTNPLTIPPLFYFAYRIGCLLIGHPGPGGGEAFHPTMKWIMGLLEHNWEPFLLGCLVTGVGLGIISYVGIHLLWRAHVVYRWRTRHARATSAMPGKADSKTGRSVASDSHSRPNSIRF